MKNVVVTPQDCDICKNLLNKFYVDGKTTSGPWADMCLPCYRYYGVGLGTGKGQKYQRNSEDSWSKCP